MKEQEAAEAQRIDFPKVAKPPFSLAESFQNSPRRSHLAKAGGDTLPTSEKCPRLGKIDARLTPARPQPEPIQEVDDESQPDSQLLTLLYQTLGSYLDDPATTQQLFLTLVPYFTQVYLPHGAVVWKQDDPADALYLIESGSLRATYAYENYPRLVQETMVAGTIAGDLSMLSDTNRNATVLVDRDCVLWKLDREGLEAMQREKGEEAGQFTRLVLKGESLPRSHRA